MEDAIRGIMIMFRVGYAGIEAAGVFTAHGDENKSEAKLNEIRDYARSL